MTKCDDTRIIHVYHDIVCVCANHFNTRSGNGFKETQLRVWSSNCADFKKDNVSWLNKQVNANEPRYRGRSHGRTWCSESNGQRYPPSKKPQSVFFKQKTTPFNDPQQN